MHFLDNVFTLQYPMYKPGSLEGGRGWLLALLLRTKALYHAALTVSAYHRRVTILSKIRHPCRVKDLVEQERHLEICLAEFQQTMKSVNQTVQGVEGLCPKHGLGIVALIIQLIFFEVGFRFEYL
jgi:C6 transcription factor Pro1